MTGSRPDDSVSGRSPSARLADLEPLSLCVFWVAGECYALDTLIVGELVHVEQSLSVPLVSPIICGLYNLRGYPLALLDTASLLGVAKRSSSKPHGGNALVLRTGELAAGLLVDRVEAVLSSTRGEIRSAEDTTAGDLVWGFLDVAERGLMVRVLANTPLIDRLAKLRVARAIAAARAAVQA